MAISSRIGATRASLFVYTVPIFVAAESVVFFAVELQGYQAVGALLVVGGVLVVSRSRIEQPHPSEVHH